MHKKIILGLIAFMSITTECHSLKIAEAANILGISVNDTGDRQKISKAYKAMAMGHHSDKQRGPDDAMQKINDA